MRYHAEPRKYLYKNNASARKKRGNLKKGKKIEDGETVYSWRKTKKKWDSRSRNEAKKIKREREEEEEEDNQVEQNQAAWNRPPWKQKLFGDVIFDGRTDRRLNHILAW